MDPGYSICAAEADLGYKRGYNIFAITVKSWFESSQGILLSIQKPYTMIYEINVFLKICKK